MIKYLLIFITLFASADDIKISIAKKEPYSNVIKTNAKITQLSNQQQQIVSSLAGHIEKYFVKAGESVKKGDRVALIESLEFSKMRQEYLALKNQEKAASYEANSAYKLYKKGISSKSDYNTKLMALQEIQSKTNTLKSQLNMLGMDSKSDKLLLYAHADGIVSKLLVPLHSSVDAQTPLMSLVNGSGYYALAYLSPNDSYKLAPDVKAYISVGDKKIACKFIQIQPTIDEKTARAKVLFWIEENPKNLLLNSYLPIEINLPQKEEAIMVESSALSLFQGEWVVFVPVEEEHDEEHHEDEEEEEEDEHHHQEEAHVPYVPNVVEIINYNGNRVAVKGLKENQEYVSDGVYFVKSMLLKSSLGGHGH